MLKLTMLPVAFALLIAPAPASAQASGLQGSMARYAPMIGNWAGSGVVRDKPDSEPLAWTSVGTIEPILGGQFVQSDIRIEFADAPGALQFREVFGWDRKLDKPLHFTLGNGSGAEQLDSRFTDGNTLVSVRHGWMDTLPEVERTVLTFSAGGYTMKVDRARGTEAMFAHVEGNFVRADKGFSARSAKADIAFQVEPHEHMKRLVPITGSYAFAGWVIPAPGGEKVGLEGSNTLDSMFGGHVMASHVTGNVTGAPGSFETWSYTTWSEDQGCYQAFAFDSGGRAYVSEARWNGAKQLVYTGVNTALPAARLQRRVLDLEDDGTVAAMFGDTLFGAAEPFRGLEITYTVASPATPK